MSQIKCTVNTIITYIPLVVGIKQERIGGGKIKLKEKRKIKKRIQKNIGEGKIRLEPDVNFLCILII